MKFNKTFSIPTSGFVGLTSAAFLIPAFAIEKPAGDDAPKQKENKEAVADEAPKAADQPVKKSAMLGVGGMAASETLSLHLGLKQGQGLTLYHIIPGSAADKAGLKEHDILTEFDGKKIGNQQDLRDVVLQKNPGDKVKVKYISRGKAQETEVELGERENQRHIQPLPGINPQWLEKNLGGDIPPAGILPMKEEMMKRLEQMQKQLRQGQGGAMKLDIGKMLREAQKGNAGRGFMNFGVGTSVTLMDNEGSISMKSNNGNKEVIVKDKAGKVLFEGPYQTEQDKAAVPEEIRERIDKLNIDKMGNGLKLKIAPMVVPPVPPAGELEEAAAE